MSRPGDFSVAQLGAMFRGKGAGLTLLEHVPHFRDGDERRLFLTGAQWRVTTNSRVVRQHGAQVRKDPDVEGRGGGDDDAGDVVSGD